MCWKVVGRFGIRARFQAPRLKIDINRFKAREDLMEFVTLVVISVTRRKR